MKPNELQHYRVSLLGVGESEPGESSGLANRLWEQIDRNPRFFTQQATEFGQVTYFVGAILSIK